MDCIVLWCWLCIVGVIAIYIFICVITSSPSIFPFCNRKLSLGATITLYVSNHQQQIQIQILGVILSVDHRCLIFAAHRWKLNFSSHFDCFFVKMTDFLKCSYSAKFNENIPRLSLKRICSYAVTKYQIVTVHFCSNSREFILNWSKSVEVGNNTLHYCWIWIEDLHTSAAFWDWTDTLSRPMKSGSKWKESPAKYCKLQIWRTRVLLRMPYDYSTCLRISHF